MELTIKDLEEFSKERLIRFACDCALVNIELIKPYTDEYDLIVEWLKNPTIENIIIAAADVVRGAAYADTYYVSDAFYAANAAFNAARTVDDDTVVRAVFAVHAAKAAGNPERIDALYEELLLG